jgi:50S ribosomal subunit-associated GTPase HflX
LAKSDPDAVFVSAKDPEDVTRLHALIVTDFENLLEDLPLFVPYDNSAVIGEVHKRARVVSESFDDDGIHYELKVTAIEAERLLRWLT